MPPVYQPLPTLGGAPQSIPTWWRCSNRQPGGLGRCSTFQNQRQRLHAQTATARTVSTRRANPPAHAISQPYGCTSL